MGQYYKVANLDKRETITQNNFHNSGSKLTETCYVGNRFVDALTHLLANDWHGDRVVYCGDYAWECMESEKWGPLLSRLASEDPYEAACSFKDRSAEFASAEGTEVYKYSSGGTWTAAPLEGTFEIESPTLRYVINETLGVYYDREEAPVAWIGWREGEPYITRTDPLMLFMAIGNGLGGGDYRIDRASNVGLVGSWAGHVIGASDERPRDLQQIRCPFDQRGILLTAPDETIRQAMAAAHLDWARTSLSELKEAIVSLEACRGIANPLNLEPEVLLMDAMSTWHTHEGQYPSNDGAPFNIDAIAESHLLDDAMTTIMVYEGVPMVLTEHPGEGSLAEVYLNEGYEVVATYRFNELYEAMKAMPGIIVDGMTSYWDLDQFARQNCIDKGFDVKDERCGVDALREEKGAEAAVQPSERGEASQENER